MGFVYFLSTEDQVFSHFKEFKAVAANKQYHKTNVLRSDYGGYFCSNNFKKYITESRIVHQRTSAYARKQSGMTKSLPHAIIKKHSGVVTN